MQTLKDLRRKFHKTTLPRTKPRKAKVIPFATPHNTFDVVPSELKAGECWVVWREEVRDGRPTKVPKDVNTGNNASADDPSTWTTFDAAVTEYKNYPAQLNGIGRVFDGFDGFMGIDFDDCLDEHGYIIPSHAAAQWLYQLNSYSEVSPSGRGVKVWVRATHDLGGKAGRRDSKLGVEIYSKQRFFTVTGARLKKYSGKVEQRQDVVEALYKSIFSTKPLDASPGGTWSGLSDDEIIKRAGAAKNGEKFKKLWAGEWEQDYGSQSEADSALCHMFWFWSGGNRETVRRMFGQSALGQRDKWQDRSDYQNSTLDAACKGDTYKGAQANTSAAPNEEIVWKPLKALLSEPVVPTEWLWQDRLVAGSLSIIAAKPKVGKSVLLRNLALAVARGEMFLGAPVKKGPVLYLSLEERREDVTADFRRMGADGSEDILIADSGTVFSAVKAVEEMKPVVLCADPLIRLTGVKDTNDYAQQYLALGPLIDVARKTGTHIVCSHHSSKIASGDAIDAPLGSTAMGGAVSTLIVLRRSQNGRRTIETRQRIGKDMEETTLNMNDETHIISMGLSAEIADVNVKSQEILNFLADKKDREFTVRDIRKAVSGRNYLVGIALQQLHTHGKVKRSGDGERGKPYQFSRSGSRDSRICTRSAGTTSPTNTETRMNKGLQVVPTNMRVSKESGNQIRSKRGKGRSGSRTSLVLGSGSRKYTREGHPRGGVQ